MPGSIFDTIANIDTARMTRRIRRAVIDFAFAGIALLLGLGFLIAAAFIYAAEMYGSFSAALAFGIGFLVLAAIIMLAHRMAVARRVRRRRRQAQSNQLRSMATAAAVAAAPALVRSLGVVGTIGIPLAAIAAYAIYRENRRPAVEDEFEDPYDRY